MYPSRPRSASAQRISHALLCLPPSSSSIHPVISRAPEMMAKRATIMHLNGDLVLANDYAAAYLQLQKEARQELEVSPGVAA